MCCCDGSIDASKMCCRRRSMAIFVDRPPAASSLCPISDVGISMIPKISTVTKKFNCGNGSIFGPFNDGVLLASRLAQ